MQSTSKLIRATLHVGLVCQTITSKPVELGKEAELTRDDVSCKLIYTANGKVWSRLDGDVGRPSELLFQDWMVSVSIHNYFALFLIEELL